MSQNCNVESENDKKVLISLDGMGVFANKELKQSTWPPTSYSYGDIWLCMWTSCLEWSLNQNMDLDHSMLCMWT